MSPRLAVLSRPVRLRSASALRYNNTCFPHAIGLGATWDVELIAEVSRITATEARVLEHLYWERSAVLYVQ